MTKAVGNRLLVLINPCPKKFSFLGCRAKI